MDFEDESKNKLFFHRFACSERILGNELSFLVLGLLLPQYLPFVDSCYLAER